MDARDAARLLKRDAGRAATATLGGAAAVLFLVFLLLIGLLGAGSSGEAFADSCGDRGTPGVDLPEDGDDSPQKPGGDTRKKQIANAKSIDSVAEDGGLSGRATLIALMTALQESTLLNLDYGHADSIGLFQQRPSAGWGTIAQIMKPNYAANMFFFGSDSGSPRGLTDIKGWQSKPFGDAAQAVQHSAFPELYAGQEEAARKVAEEAHINLSRTGKGDDAGESDTDKDTEQEQGSNDDKCYDDASTEEPGKPFHDGDAPWPSKASNPRSTRDAIKWAKRQEEIHSPGWYRQCLAFASQAYGWNFSGVQYAIDHYRHMPASMKHDKERTPPPGALMYWDTGSRAGHVAVYLGEGKIASNDIREPGYISVVPATDIEKKWGATYLGWAPPYFPKGG